MPAEQAYSGFALAFIEMLKKNQLPTFTGPPPRGSAVELLVHAVEAHERAEQASLADYGRLLDEVRDPLVKLLMQLLLEDEQRHHELLRRMATTLRNDMQWSRSDGALPPDTQPGESNRGQLLETTWMRLKEERRGICTFRQLARDHRNLYNGLFALLFEIMARDSDKHEQILTFIEKRLEKKR